MRRFLAAAVFFCLVSAVFAAEPERPYLLTGIDTIPKDAIVLSRSQTRDILAVSDVVDAGFGIGFVLGHNWTVRNAACLAFITGCIDSDDFATTPFTFLGPNPPLGGGGSVQKTEWLMRELRRMGGVKIVTQSRSVDSHGSVIATYGDSLPWVMIEAAGNERVDNFFQNKHRGNTLYDRSGNVFRRISDRSIVTRDEDPGLYNIREAVEAQKVIITSNYLLEQGQPYTHNKGCVGVEESCVYVPGSFGTSEATATLGSALTSLLSVFPEYDHNNLAMLTNICAKSYSSLPGGGIVDVPCMIETICAETGSSSTACDVPQPLADPIFNNTRIGVLENPKADSDLVYANVSGISAISGWVCDAEEIIIEINDTSWEAGYGTTRGDTRDDCGDDDNGFSLLLNWNLLGDGVHTVKAYADGRHFATMRVKVTTVHGNEFIRDMVVNTPPFPFNGRDYHLVWEESLQNFVIADGTEIDLQRGYAAVAGIHGRLENPSLGSPQSGISAISGWVCDAEEIIIEIGGTSWEAGYGTSRGDTKDECGDDDNGFSLLLNWNLFGDGVHTVKAYADGTLFASTQVKVTTFGQEFLRGLKDKAPEHLPLYGRIYLEWWESQQNFVIVEQKEYL